MTRGLKKLALLWATLRLAARRLWANRRMAAGLLAGLTVAVAAASSVPAFAGGALQRVLQAELAADREQNAAGIHLAHLENAKRRTKAGDLANADRVAVEQGPGLIGLPVDELVRYGALEPTAATPVNPAQLNPDVARWASLAFQTGLADHVEVYDGRLPGTAQDGLEAMVEEEALDKLELTVGAELWVPVGKDPGADKVKVTVVGAFRRKDPNDPHWFQRQPFEQALFIPEDGFRQQVLGMGKVEVGQYSWFYAVDPSRLKVTDAVRLLTALYDLEARMAQALPDTTLFAGPMEILTRFAVKAQELQLMLTLLAAPTLAVVGYFILMTAGMIVERQRQEIAVLRSRGAGLWQILAVYSLEGTLLAAVALAAGLPLGLLLARAMGAAAGFLQFVDRTLPPPLLGRDFWLYGAAAALAGVVAYVAPVLPAARQSIIGYKQQSARGSRLTAWGRLGLDLLCLGLAGYSYWVLAGRPTAGTGALVEPLNLLAPALFVTGGGLLLLRALPLLSGLVYRLAERWAPAPLYLALAQLSRAPSRSTPVVLLLTLTVGMGLYGAATARTLERNTADRIGYAGGADVILHEAWGFLEEEGDVTDDQTQGEFVAPPWEVHYGLPGVIHPARVRRQEVTASVGGRGGRKGTLMAIDPQDFGQVAWFRRDLAPAHLNAYLNLLAADEEAVLVSREFLDRNKLKPGDRVTLSGDEGQEVSLVVYGSVNYWPTLYPSRGEFFVANLPYVEEALGLLPTEVWLRLAEGAKLQPIVDALEQESVATLRVDDHRKQLIEARRDPQLGGLLGGLTNGFLLAAAISVLGFLLYATLSMQARVLQFGVLRALGLTARQLTGAVALEQVLTVGAGVGAGAWLGIAAARLYVPFLQHGAERTPPFLVVTAAADRTRLFAVLLLMLGAGVAVLVANLSRLRIHEAVKLGEDH